MSSKEKKLKRFLEILPGGIAWLILLSPFIFGIWLPRFVAYFMIFFYFYWLVKAFLMGGYLISSYLHMRRDNKIDWLERCKKLDELDEYIFEKTEELFKTNFFMRKRTREELQELIALKEMGEEYKKSWEDIYHVVILPHYNDEYRILQSAIKSLAVSNFPTNKTIVVIGLEDREEGTDKFKRTEEAIKEFGKEFYNIFIPFIQMALWGK